jgi:uncharacterized protein YbjT (DUF2867 family)
MKIAVAGGTGTVGKHVVEAAGGAGHETVVLSRSTGIDLMTGAGLAAALAGADAVIDVSSTNTMSAQKSKRFFGTVTRNLREAERAAGVRHHIALSIIGAAEVPAAYYAGKALQEELLLSGSARDWSVLRAAQFHEFAQQLVHRGKVGPLQLVPTMRSQPIAAAEVARELVAIASGDPRGLATDLAGPREENMADLVRRYLRATGASSPVLQVPFPGAWGTSMRDGTLLPGAGAQLGRQTFEEWLSARPA